MSSRARVLAIHAVPRFTKLRSAAYTYVWTKENDHLLPDHYKKRAVEFMTSDPKPVHWIPDERKYKLADNKKEVLPVQNVPIPLKFPKEANLGLWGGEGIIQGFRKKRYQGFRCPRLWVPQLKKEVLYSEILDRWMGITVTDRTLDLIDEAEGFDHYILGTSERDINSLLGMKLKREMLLALAQKSLYPDDLDKRERVYKKYKKYAIPGVIVLCYLAICPICYLRICLFWIVSAPPPILF